MNEEIKTTLEARGGRYGDFKDNAEVTQGLIEIVQSRDEWETLSPIHKETIRMIFHKLSRMICGDPNYDDNLVDIIGYTTLLLEEIRK